MARIKRKNAKKETQKTARKKKVTVRKEKKVSIKKMPKSKLRGYKELLLKERIKLTNELSTLSKDNLKKSQKDASGDLSGYAYHMADLASDSYDREFSLGLASEEQKKLFSIDEALRRIKDGTYGSCLQCGKVISTKRLKAIPNTELCIDCQKSQEEKQ